MAFLTLAMPCRTLSRLTTLLALVCAAFGSAGCTEVSVDTAREDASGVGGNGQGGSAQGGGAGVGGAEVPWPGSRLELRLDGGSTYIDLNLAELVSDNSDWDLHLDGLELYTNSGASGDGAGGAFGPLAEQAFFEGRYPEVPFISIDEPSGALGGWYAYDGTNHTLYSKFHTYAIRSREQTFKLQVLSYYGDVQGAPVSAVYSVRYAELDSEGVGPLHELAHIDASAGWPATSASSPSSCLTLATQAIRLLTPRAAQEDSAWDLCFRRDTISVNGQLGGPGGVSAVDLDAATDDSLEHVTALTPQGTRAAFERVGWAQVTDPRLDYRGDRIVSAFTDSWLASTNPISVQQASWLALSANGSAYLLAFTQDAPADPAQVTLHLLSLDD